MALDHEFLRQIHVALKQENWEAVKRLQLARRDVQTILTEEKLEPTPRTSKRRREQLLYLGTRPELRTFSHMLAIDEHQPLSDLASCLGVRGRGESKVHVATLMPQDPDGKLSGRKHSPGGFIPHYIATDGEIFDIAMGVERWYHDLAFSIKKATYYSTIQFDNQPDGTFNTDSGFIELYTIFSAKDVHAAFDFWQIPLSITPNKRRSKPSSQ